MEHFDCKKLLSKEKLIPLFCCAAVGLLLMALFVGKKRMELSAIAVSPNEQYIAFNESFEWLGKGNRWEKILCFHADGSFAFQFDISPDISAGGTCALWFDEDVLCVLFYRTDKIVRFAMDGTVLDTIPYTVEEDPPKFPSFEKSGHRYVYSGKAIDVVYDKCSFLGYWFFHAERYLEILPKCEEAKIVWIGAIV